MEITFPRVEGYRVELPEEPLTATFNADSRLVLTPELVGPCRVLLEGIVGEGLSPKSVAEVFGIFERYVYRLFAQQGLRFGAQVRSRRLEGAAAELSRSSRTRIMDIAYKWGFADLSTFIKAFKQKFGCTPREFRRGH